MNGYDHHFDRNQRYGQDYSSKPRGGRSGAEYQGRMWGPDMSGLPPAGMGGRGVGNYRQWGTAGEAGRGGGYDRGEYGGAYAGYGGYPGGVQRGSYYGGRGGYDANFEPAGAGRDRYMLEPERFGGRGWVTDQGMRGGSGRGYGGDYAREPFMPETAYQRHPEYHQPPTHRGGGWSSGGQGAAVQMDDGEIRQAVRENLYQDAFLDVDRITVTVAGGVVTLAGEVDDFMEARYAWDDAWEVDGVHGVLNQLTVRVDQPAEESPAAVQPQSSSKGSGKKS